MRRESSSVIIRRNVRQRVQSPGPSSTMRLTSRRTQCSALPLKLLIPALLLCAGSAGGLDPGRPSTEFARRAWQTDSGLPQNTVHSIAQTRDGYVWVATEEGLRRFREGKFTNFTTKDGLEGGGVLAVAEDAEGGLWVGTDEGLSRFHEGVFTTETTGDGPTR